MEWIKHKIARFILDRIEIDNRTVEYGGRAKRKLETTISFMGYSDIQEEKIMANGKLYNHIELEYLNK